MVLQVYLCIHINSVYALNSPTLQLSPTWKSMAIGLAVRAKQMQQSVNVKFFYVLLGLAETWDMCSLCADYKNTITPG